MQLPKAPVPIVRSHPALLGLFLQHRRLAQLREAIFEDRLGKAWADDPENPRIARLDLGGYSFLGGDPEAPSAERLITEAEHRPCEFIYPNTAWREKVLRVCGDAVRDRPMNCYSPASLDRETLRTFVDALPAGFVLQPFTLEDLRKLDDALFPHGMKVFPNAEVMKKDGMAWGIFTDDDRRRIACAATSYAISSRSVEVAISTHVDHRGRGLAGTAAARFCLDALDRGLEPCWSASNPVSQRLALRLGFVFEAECEILLLD